jgi:hypothetical protein
MKKKSSILELKTLNKVLSLCVTPAEAGSQKGAYAIRPYGIPGFRVALAIASLPGMTIA